MSRRDPWRIALFSGLAVALAALAVAAVGVAPALPPLLYLAAVTPELWRVDVARHRLPNALVLPGYPVVVTGLVWQGVQDAAALPLALACTLGYPLFLLLLHAGGGMGMGDVKLGLLIGGALGLVGVGATVVGVVLAFLGGGVVAASALVLARRRRSPAARMPFGPFMLAGAWLAPALDGLVLVP
ncbi:prepilin peptidase [Compostimonas suwonensis]|uniref:Leader peptidase (Prepilin peptidase)/N-methyltransferase n=1 Tax=Compostimonas suwonensis TaxID=1048394 RepID=A0A2M9BW82_9MICO|nr:prepilin peptidase [Compostimonas suwonensis]PJJ62218.1 leader peptidase (prepilin peptidase)/N-methyltransferase [Compostimonas suwonensis]